MEMTDYDAFYVWLGIPPEEQPPNHYRLLGIPVFESNPEVIRNAADRQAIFVKRLGVNQFEEIGQGILNEIMNAKLCLLKSDKKMQYDVELKQSIQKRAASSVHFRASTYSQNHVWKVGANPANDFVLKNTSVSWLHCEMRLQGKDIMLRDLKSLNGTSVNGKRINEPTKVLPFDLVLLGKSVRLKLPRKIFSEPAGPTHYGTLGRDAQCEVRFDKDFQVSRFHARYWIEDAELFIEDFGSRNGTRIIDADKKQYTLVPYEPFLVEGTSTISVGNQSFPASHLIRG
jgi:pSer/pThr/pTyr-binding forkhead associated (FHA) protein